jgi:hypothetical protein
MSSIKRIFQAVVVGVVLVQIATGFGIVTTVAGEPADFPAEELPFDPDEALPFDPNEMDLEFPGDLEYSEERAQQDAAEAAAAAAGFFCVWSFCMLGGLAIAIVILWFLSSSLAAVPPEYRDMEPGMVWLMLIPLFNIIWQFFVAARISSSYQRAFAAQGNTAHGDCGAAIGLWYCICTLIPCVNIVALALGIVYLIKLTGMRKAVRAAP